MDKKNLEGSRQDRRQASKEVGGVSTGNRELEPKESRTRLKGR